MSQIQKTLSMLHKNNFRNKLCLDGKTTAGPTHQKILAGDYVPGPKTQTPLLYTDMQGRARPSEIFAQTCCTLTCEAEHATH
jgi:hypothetical protein